MSKLYMKANAQTRSGRRNAGGTTTRPRRTARGQQQQPTGIIGRARAAAGRLFNRG